MTVVVKVGGSLYDLPDLGPRLRRWLAQLDARRIVLVPGGGAAADVVRAWDRVHSLGEEQAHWLALQAVSLNARFVAGLLPSARIVHGLAELKDAAHAMLVLDAYGFACADEGRPGALPHTWDVTSDSIAARCAVVCGADRLVLLKSVEFPRGMSWEEAGERGIVDHLFARVVRGAPGMQVTVANLRDE